MSGVNDYVIHMTESSMVPKPPNFGIIILFNIYFALAQAPSHIIGTLNLYKDSLAWSSGAYITLLSCLLGIPSLLCVLYLVSLLFPPSCGMQLPFISFNYQLRITKTINARGAEDLGR